MVGKYKQIKSIGHAVYTLQNKTHTKFLLQNVKGRDHVVSLDESAE
jgi:hypothetical protein